MKDQDLEDQIKANTNLVYKVVHQMGRNRYDFDDMFSAGMRGLWRALKTHDDKKSKLSTYAYSCIRNAILNSRRDQRRFFKACTKSNFDDRTTGGEHDWDSFLDGFSDLEKRVAIDYYIFKLSGAAVKRDLGISDRRFQKIKEQVVAKTVQLVQ